MHRLAASLVAALVASSVAACSGAPAGSEPRSSSTAGTGSGGAGGAVGTGGASEDGGTGGGGDPDAGTGTDCSVDGVPGQCLEVSACAALTGYSSTPGYCPGPADIECCTMTPSPADNPPTPAGYQLMAQSDVTPAMTAWAVSILDDPADYPMFATAIMTFGTLTVLARVEWHPPDFQNGVVHRGVTLYEPV